MSQTIVLENGVALGDFAISENFINSNADGTLIAMYGFDMLPQEGTSDEATLALNKSEDIIWLHSSSSLKTPYEGKGSLLIQGFEPSIDKVYFSQRDLNNGLYGVYFDLTKDGVKDFVIGIPSTSRSLGEGSINDHILVLSGISPDELKLSKDASGKYRILPSPSVITDNQYLPTELSLADTTGRYWNNTSYTNTSVNTSTATSSGAGDNSGVIKNASSYSIIDLTGNFTSEYFQDTRDRFKAIEKINYYIHDEVSLIDPTTVTYSWSHWDDHEKFINDLFKNIDEYIDLDFTRTYSIPNAHIEIYRVSPSSPYIQEDGIIGYAPKSSRIAQLVGNSGLASKSFGEYRFAFWSSPDAASPTFIKDYGILTYSEASTIIHEIGHSLGLSHPQNNNQDDPKGAGHNTQITVMSYNKNPHYDRFGIFSGPPFWSDFDRQTLVEIWGAENDNKAVPSTANINSNSTSAPNNSNSTNTLNTWNFRFDSSVKVKDIVNHWFGTTTPATKQTQDVSDTKLMDINASSWSEKVQINRVAKASDNGDVLEGKQRDATVDGVVGSVLSGGKGSDRIQAMAGWDIIDGGEGRDLVRAGNGRDILTGGLGSDELWGGFGWNTYKGDKDRSEDLLVIKSDEWQVNSLNGKAGNNPDGSKCDIIEALDSIDKIIIQGVKTSDLRFAGNVTGQGLVGIGIYAKGALEALYTGVDLTVAQLTAMTTGDITGPANGTYWSW
jgi:Ca2+-binding RTX toxin-like protein